MDALCLNHLGFLPLSGFLKSQRRRAAKPNLLRNFKVRVQSGDQGTEKERTKSRFTYLTRTHTLTLLKQQMRVAVANEDYKEAARLRDALKAFEDREPTLRLKNLLKKAIAEERFEDAARYKEELQRIEPEALLKCCSDCTTHGIRVQVKSVYVPGRSHPLKGRYFFAYRIKISNLGHWSVQLLNRHWAITDATGKTEHVW
eukprot:TRINITY_DN714_c0_g1_i2.p1 TRINITY_DN714_c0_g1~~TRINITY_DN714_c0_g1_i2.p1  ORF type:complete len:201 (+),score=20.26 TRINITY_DN714_c0_g1_i2:105-707(+)